MVMLERKYIDETKQLSNQLLSVIFNQLLLGFN